MDIIYYRSLLLSQFLKYKLTDSVCYIHKRNFDDDIGFLSFSSISVVEHKNWGQKYD